MLLRVAGLPLEMWLAGAEPGLFATPADLETAERAYAMTARRLARLIGADLIGDPRRLAARRSRDTA